MPKNRPNPRLAKLHRNYTVEEVASLYAVHRNTVRAWIKAGLPTVDAKRPVLVLGRHLADFLQRRRTVNKRSCGPGQMFCLRCREPRHPEAGQVRYRPLTEKQGNLAARCGHCGAGMNRRVSLAKLAAVCGDWWPLPTQPQDHIDQPATPSLNSDFAQDAANHANASP